MTTVADIKKMSRQPVMYVLMGILTTIVSWGTYYIFADTLSLDLNLSNILSWVCGVSFAFVVNKWYVFEARSLEKHVVGKEFTFFIASRLFTGIIAWILFPILIYIGIDKLFLDTSGMYAKIITSVVEIILNWILSKYYVFKKAD